MVGWPDIARASRYARSLPALQLPPTSRREEEGLEEGRPQPSVWRRPRCRRALHPDSPSPWSRASTRRQHQGRSSGSGMPTPAFHRPSSAPEFPAPRSGCLAPSGQRALRIWLNMAPLGKNHCCSVLRLCRRRRLRGGIDRRRNPPAVPYCNGEAATRVELVAEWPLDRLQYQYDSDGGARSSMQIDVRAWAGTLLNPASQGFVW